MLCADVVEACWTDGNGDTQRANALLEDISPSGACLQLETAVPLGVALRWGSPKQEFTGEVRYCVYREIGYFVGVEFDTRSKWSKKAYKPQHLLDLQRLMTAAKKPAYASGRMQPVKVARRSCAEQQLPWMRKP